MEFGETEMDFVNLEAPVTTTTGRLVIVEDKR